MSVSVRASVTAGFAKQVDGVKSMAAPTKPATAKAVSATRPLRPTVLTTRIRPKVATASESHRVQPVRSTPDTVTAGSSNIRLATMTPSAAPTIWATTKAAAVGPAISRRNRPAIVTSGFR